MLCRFFLLLCVFLTACQQDSTPANEIRIALAQGVMSLDPRYATDASSHKVQDLIHCSLLTLDEHFMAQPSMATWQQQDRYTWLFSLKKDVLFQDGSAVRSQDVVATLRAIMDKKKASPLRAGFASIQSFDILSEQHFVLHLNREDPSLLTRLSIGILPESWASKPHQARQTMGCGVFQVQAWDHSQGLLLAHRSRSLSLRFMHVKDPVTRILKLVQGEIDFTQNDLPVHLLPFVEKYPDIRLQSRASSNFSYIGLNLEDPILQHLAVRQALALAVDREKLKKVLFGDYPTLATTILSPQHWASANLMQIKFDPEKAKKILDAAGFKADARGIRFHLSYRTSTNPIRLRMATAVAAMWQTIGIDVAVESMEWGGFYGRIKQGDFQVFSLAWVGISDPDIYKWVLHSDMFPPKGANRGRYHNPEVDHLLDTLTQENMLAHYQRIQAIMLHDVVYIPLWYDAVITLSNQRVQGFEPTWNASFMPFTQVKVNERMPVN